MTTTEEGYPEFAPSFSADTHFPQLRRFNELQFDPDKCARLLTHPTIGIDESDLQRIHIYVRPDYDRAYSKAERKQLKAAERREYDSEHASCQIIEASDDPRLGQIGDVLITLVYGSGYGLGKLLCHEAIHAREMLKKYKLIEGIARTLISPVAGIFEEREADRVMNDPELKPLRKGIIQIKKS